MRSHGEEMINENRANKAMEWLRGYIRAKSGNSVEVVKTDRGIKLVAKTQISDVDSRALCKSIPKEIIASIGNISASVPLGRR